MPESPFRHPDPGVRMPVPRDMVVSASQDEDDFERMTEKDAAKSLAKSQKPRQPDNRGADPALGGARSNR